MVQTVIVTSHGSYDRSQNRHHWPVGVN